MNSSTASNSTTLHIYCAPLTRPDDVFSTYVRAPLDWYIAHGNYGPLRNAKVSIRRARARPARTGAIKSSLSRAAGRHHYGPSEVELLWRLIESRLIQTYAHGLALPTDTRFNGTPSALERRLLEEYSKISSSEHTGDVRQSLVRFASLLRRTGPSNVVSCARALVAMVILSERQPRVIQLLQRVLEWMDARDVAVQRVRKRQRCKRAGGVHHEWDAQVVWWPVVSRRMDVESAMYRLRCDDLEPGSDDIARRRWLERYKAEPAWWRHIRRPGKDIPTVFILARLSHLERLYGARLRSPARTR